ncbi:hypothetical protein AOLI_G00306980 [Acnodon oligacanthus]
MWTEPLTGSCARTRSATRTLHLRTSGETDTTTTCQVRLAQASLSRRSDRLRTEDGETCAASLLRLLQCRQTQRRAALHPDISQFTGPSVSGAGQPGEALLLAVNSAAYMAASTPVPTVACSGKGRRTRRTYYEARGLLCIFVYGVMNIVGAMLGPATLSDQSVWARGTLMTQLASARPGLQKAETARVLILILQKVRALVWRTERKWKDECPIKIHMSAIRT